MSDIDVRKGMTNARFNEKNINILSGEIIIVATIAGVMYKSWWVFGVVLLALIIGIVITRIAIFLAIDDAQKSEELWKKFKNSVQGRYSKNKKFGEERIDGRNSFWYIDQNNIRYFVTFDKRGIYTGNNVNLIKNALKAKTFEKNSLQTSKVPLNDKTFFFMNIKKNPFLRNMLLMRSQDSAAIAPLLSKLKEMNIFCEKLDRHISIGIDIELKGN